MSVIDSVAVIRARVVQIVASNDDAAVHLGQAPKAPAPDDVSHDWTNAPTIGDRTFLVPMTPAQALSLQPDEVLELIVRRAAQ